MTNSELQTADRLETPRQSASRNATPPNAPRSVEETGLDEQMLVELITKILYLRGSMSLIGLAQQTRLPATITESLCEFMRVSRLLEVLSRGGTSGDANYGLTEHGRTRAKDFLNKCHYVGPAPVTLASYAQQVRGQSFANMRISRNNVENAYRDLVIRQELRDLVGSAMNSGKPMFLYGPSGSGKTFLAESLMRLVHGTIYVPYAFVVEGEIIQIFDPIIHRPINAESTQFMRSSIDNRQRTDERWVACHRPVAISGGELTLSMLDLNYDRRAGFYQAPMHIRANNGLYIIDDLGRQLVRPEELMNRWIVPMDRRRDYLSLHTGGSFEVPFDIKLVFSTNISPKTLADEAFLRRLGYKIHVDAVSHEEYEQIFRGVCSEFDIAFSTEAFTYLLDMHQREKRPTFACYPRDLISQVRDYSAYCERPAELSPQLIDWAWHSYFAEH